MKSNQSAEQHKNEDLISNILEEISTIGAKSGVIFEATSPESQNRLRNLPREVSLQISQNLQIYSSILQSIEPDLPRDQYQRELLRNALKVLKLDVPTDFIEKIAGDDICEIYDLESDVQIFRNLEFLRYCTYDLGTILSYSWPDLFYRDPKIDEAIAKRSADITLNGTGTEPWNVPNHIVTEILHKKRNQFQLHLGHIAPVLNKETGKRQAWISTIKVAPLGSDYKHLGNVTPI